MTHPYSDISKIAHASGSILGISKNLLGGPDSVLETLAPTGLLGELEQLIKDGDTHRALTKLSYIRQQVSDIKTYVKEI